MEPVRHDKSHRTIATACNHGNATSFASATRSKNGCLGNALGRHGDKNNNVRLHKPLNEVDILTKGL
jgi:hypothetical protein